ncbi:MAG TPA: adenylyltransferase/cytidyltransferase family protein, partial [Candidatus Saccharimonadales bacterium]|nr:adenylyltransferase/cytidyltransferase family protein [Candidatus Saccharimonadales bacterium]
MIVTINDLAKIREQYQDQKLILSSGTFDLLHVGHLHYLQAAKTYGDVLIVLLSGDQRIKARKGDDRPIIPEVDRTEMLDALKIVD